MPAQADDSEENKARRTNKGVDLRSHGRQIADEVRTHGLAVPNHVEGRGHHGREDRHDEDVFDVPVNDPALDHVQTFAGTRPFEFSIQSETSIAAFRHHILIGYNSSADQPVVQTGGVLSFAHRHFSGFSVSNDGGHTWTSGFVPPVTGSPFTFGDPSVGVDRAGNFYYAHLGTAADSNFTGAVIINKSTDRGATFAPATIVAVDDGSDKEWLAVGRDPFHHRRDNLYIAWTSFQPNGSELRFARSTNGGATWTSKTLFAPVDGGPAGMSAFIQFANPTVDASNGRLYIPFIHFSNADAEFIKVLVSDDAGDTFTFLEFNIPGAPDKFGFAVVTPGTLTDCGTGGGFRTVLHQGADLGGGHFGLPRFRQSTRLITQPSAAATKGKLFIAFNASTSPFFGDPNSRSEIRLLFSRDGGHTFAGPFTVAAATDMNPQHVHPSVSVDKDGEHVSVAYYVQQADGKIRVDLTSGKMEGRGRRFRAKASVRVSDVSFDLIPSNNPFPVPGDPSFTTNYDRTVAACYNLGEYLGITQKHEDVLAAWGDNRNTWTSPPGSPAPGTHAQPDVFFQAMER